MCIRDRVKPLVTLLTHVIAQDNRACLSRTTGLICLPRITDIMAEEKKTISFTFKHTAGPPSNMTTVVKTVFDVDDLIIKRTRNCSVCKVVEVVIPISRCKECNAINMRVMRCRESLDEESLKSWDNMSKEKRVEFIKEARGLMGHQLKAKMRMFATQVMENKVTISTQGQGIYRDSKDLGKSTKTNRNN